MQSAHRNSTTRPLTYKWFVLNDLNGFFSVMFDNMTVLAFLAFILTQIFCMPPSFIYGKIFPGTALAVLCGDLVFTWLAFIQTEKQGRSATAIPVAIDTPSTVGLAFAVLGPTFLTYKAAGLSPDDAAIQTWYVGMAVVMCCGLGKLLGAFIGEWIANIVPKAGLVGALAGVGIALLGVVPFIEVMGAPAVGLLSFGIVFYSLVAKIELPGKIPGVLAAVVSATVLYYILGPLGLAGQQFTIPFFSIAFYCPWPTINFINGLSDSLQYLPVVLPFTILTVVGGVNVAKGAVIAGDNYNIRQVLQIDAVVTIISALCGGVAPTTLYIGHAAFKGMNCRAGHVFLTGIFVGLFGLFGLIKVIVDFVPTAALAPILIFIALELTSQAFRDSDNNFRTALTFALFPCIMRALALKGNYSDNFDSLISRLMAEANGHRYLSENLIIPALGNGFVLTSMLWGAFLAFFIERRLRRAAVVLFILAACSFIGLVHSVSPDGFMYWPFNLSNEVERAIPFQFASGYFLAGTVIWILSYTKSSALSIFVEDDKLSTE
ncbi:MAG: hypothetical protein ACI376_04355 [Candidatus Bruticola sp.]